MVGRSRAGGSWCRPSLFLLVFLSASSTYGATDTLRQGESIRDGLDALVSARGAFGLGFIGVGSSSERYLAIWYRDVKFRAVWVANRDKPLISSSSNALTIDKSGYLMIRDGAGNSVTLAKGPGMANSYAILLDSGNLVMRSADSNQTLWQSFDHPTDTWLPGMRLGGGRSTLTSWRSENDPSTGKYVLEANGTELRLVSGDGGMPLWGSGDLAEGVTAGNLSSPWGSYFPTARLSYVNESNTVESGYLVYSTAATSDQLTRIVAESDGQVRLWVWTRGWDEWRVVWGAPEKYKCEAADYCGPNTLCNNATTPPCECLQGFEPSSPDKWNSGDWSGGCARRLPLCRPGEGFLRLQGIRQPYSPDNLMDSSNATELGRCRDVCLAYCGCSAYALAYEKSPGCYLWSDPLVGLQENYSRGAEIYLRLAAPELNRTSDTNATAAHVPNRSKPGDVRSGGSRRPWLIALPILSVAILLCGVPLACFLRRKFQGGDAEETGEELLMRDIGVDGAVAYRFIDSKGGGIERGPEICVYDLSDVLTATDSFSDGNKLGEGGFGPVYKGKLPDGKEIAVKRLSTQSGQGLKEFKTEILLIARLQHKNLVRLLGCCIQGEERLLIYEYMPNKSLDFFLFDRERAATLDWGRRMRIIEGIVQGLLYLHKYSRLTIIHRDLKASNILLDNEMNPKISDFGMARIFSSNQDRSNTNRIVGTYGYMSPEYAMQGIFSIKSDVFSFGVLLLEVVSGRRNTGSHHYFPIPRSLLGHAWELWNAGRALELMDPSLGGSWPEQEASRCIYVGLMCVQEFANDRPTMTDVVTMLGSESSTLVAPKQPAFLTERHTTQESSSSNSAVSGSKNTVTISALEGR